MSITWPNCVRMPPPCLMPCGQWTTMPLRVPPKSEATCLVHLNGESKATAQAAAMCGKVSLLPHLSIKRNQVLDLFLHAVEVGHLVVHADHAALGARAVVAGDVEDQRVVQFADLLDRIHETADMVIGVGDEAGEHLGLAAEQFLVRFRQRIPGGEILRLRRQLRVGGNDARLLLPLEGRLAHLVPALIELAVELLDPLLAARDAARGSRRSRNT